MGKYISEESEDREHHDECCPDPDIPPRDKPEGSESYSEREVKDSSIVDSLFSFLEKCDIDTSDDP